MVFNNKQLRILKDWFNDLFKVGILDFVCRLRKIKIGFRKDVRLSSSDGKQVSFSLYMIDHKISVFAEVDLCFSFVRLHIRSSVSRFIK